MAKKQQIIIRDPKRKKLDLLKRELHRYVHLERQLAREGHQDARHNVGTYCYLLCVELVGLTGDSTYWELLNDDKE